MNLKLKLRTILHSNYHDKGWIYLLDDYLITGLIVLNIIAIILESFELLYQTYKTTFVAFDIISVFFFTVEYFIRIWIADIDNEGNKHESPIKERLKYILSPLGLTDLLAILPFYIPFIINIDLRALRILRLFRLFRIFKLAHYNQSLRLVIRVIRSKGDELFITILLSLIILLVSSSLMYNIEHEVQPDKFPNIFSSFWWAIATLTTIGYGDVFPVTGWGQFVAAITALFGIGLVAIPTGILAMGFMEELTKIKEAKARKKGKMHNNEVHENMDYNYCPHCGKKLKEQERIH